MDEREGPTVSVALGAFNGERYIAEQLRSILAQTFPVTEIVIADDGSTDGTLAVVDTVIAEHRIEHPGRTPAVVVLAGEPQRGVAANFERALRACSGELIALSDQDDTWHPDRVERMVTALGEAPDAGLLHSDARLVDATGGDLGLTLLTALGVTPAERAALIAGRPFEVFLRRNLATGATSMLRASLRDAALPIPEGWIHDEWLAMVAAATGRTLLLDQTLTRYRQHGGNQIGAHKPRLIDLLGRLREPRQPRNRRLLQRARSLAERFAELDGVSEERRAATRSKLIHETRRSALPAVRIARLGGVLAGGLGGGYRRFGNGAQDMLRDLVQPAAEASA